MGYADLIRRAWRTGRFSAEAAGAGGRASPGAAESRGRIRSEMEEIVRREAAEALGCLAGRREGGMKLAPFVKFREEKFGAVLFETRSERVFTLNGTGAAVVREILAGATEEDLARRVKARYEDRKGNLDTEVAGLVHQLKERKLVVV